MRTLAGFVASGLLGLALAASAQQDSEKQHQIFDVEISNPLTGRPETTGLDGPFSGRLIIQLSPSLPKGMRLPDLPKGTQLTPAQQEARKRAEEGMVNGNFRSAARTPFPGLYAAAMEVSNVRPGDVIEVDVDRLASPGPFSSLPPGDYYASAVLDMRNDFAITNGAGPEDLTSSVQKITLGGGRPRLTLTWRNDANLTNWPPLYPQMAAVREATRDVNFLSPSLSAFYGRPTHIRGYVLLPPGYDPNAQITYPVAYDFGLATSFGLTFDMLPVLQVLQRHAPMYQREAPPLLWVMLDQTVTEGPHGFMDSAANGPWASALTDEFVPWLEQQYRADAKPMGRVLVGGGAGGRTALWLLAKRPNMFAGAWVDSPDSVDFHSFFGTDIYATGANLFNATGEQKLIFRERSVQGGWLGYTARALSGLETIYGPGSKLASTERMFSPLDADGKPQALFDRSTGAIDPVVARYWGGHYDLSNYLAANWPELKSDLDGKIHIAVGSYDKSYRNEAVARLKQTLDRLGAKSDIRIYEGRTEDSLPSSQTGFADSMYAVVRPGVVWAASRN